MIRHFSIILLAIGAFAALGYFVHEDFYYAFIIIAPLVLITLHDMFQKKHTILRNFPLIGHFRYIFESIRPEINQYFIESDIDGRPFNRSMRSIVYQRAKGVLDKEPFGTKLDYSENGFEWLLHSAGSHNQIEDLSVTIGGPDCKQAYKSSLLNISAMSYGSLSKEAVMALNWGAKKGGFAHNTGEGGISSHHTKYGGDLIWQIGTGYFGCRDEEGNFNEESYEQKAKLPNVKMIELKVSQGAKPGQGGILPARKNDEEIAEIRQVKPHTEIISPSFHKAYRTPLEMMQFIKKLRDLSGGKPVGFKMCLGNRREFLSICKAMVKSGIKPDFITVDGAEGGTGAAPLEYANYVGNPLVEGLVFIHDALCGFDLKKDIKLIASGKVITGFHIIRLLALGADLCYSARAMMMAAGCIQALRCHNNTCPTGVTSHDPKLTRGLVVPDKAERVARYQMGTIKSVKSLLDSTGINYLDEIDRSMICRRIDSQTVRTLDELYPYWRTGILLKPPYPESIHKAMMAANVDSFHPDKEPEKLREQYMPQSS